MERGEVLRSVVVVMRLGPLRASTGSRTNGTFSLDGEDFEVENNIWLRRRRRRGGRRRRRARGRADRRRRRRAAGGGHRLHARPQRPHQRRPRPGRRAPARRCWLHPDDRMLWDAVYPDRGPTRRSPTGSVVEVAGGEPRRVLHTPGHSPRRRAACTMRARRRPSSAATPCSTAAPARPAGRSPTSATIVESIRTRLLTLPAATDVHTGHGDDTRSATRPRTSTSGSPGATDGPCIGRARAAGLHRCHSPSSTGRSSTSTASGGCSTAPRRSRSVARWGSPRPPTTGGSVSWSTRPARSSTTRW